MDAQSGKDLVYAVLRASGALLRESRRFFRRFGITEAQFNVLNILGEAPEGMSQRELGDFLVVDRSNVTGLLDRMEREGWVQRRPEPGDRRAHRVSLTASGRKLWKRALPAYDAALAELTAPIDESHGAIARQVAARLAAEAEIVTGRSGKESAS
jgi:DNA-binding MarR family transcriptional regulator